MTTDNHPKRAGRFESAIQKLFTRSAQVLRVDQPGDNFRLITLGGEALRNAGWTPGDKIQIQFGGWVQRTYTPMDWDADSGQTRILVYLHGDAPGAQWARSVKAGDSCVLFGPRKSVRLAQPSSVILFGDETSIGLAAALAHTARVHLLCEAAVLAGARDVMAQLALVNVALDNVTLTRDDRIAALAQAHPLAHIVLTGSAAAIQQISRVLREQGIASGRRQSKAYWAAGKTGLD